MYAGAHLGGLYLKREQALRSSCSVVGTQTHLLISEIRVLMKYRWHQLDARVCVWGGGEDH